MADTSRSTETRSSTEKQSNEGQLAEGQPATKNTEPLWARNKSKTQLVEICNKLGIDADIKWKRKKMIEKCDLLGVFPSLTIEDLRDTCANEYKIQPDFISNASKDELVKCVVESKTIDWTRQIEIFKKQIGVSDKAELQKDLNLISSTMTQNERGDFNRLKGEFLKDVDSQEEIVKDWAEQTGVQIDELNFFYKMIPVVSEAVKEEMQNQLSIITTFSTAQINQNEGLLSRAWNKVWGAIPFKSTIATGFSKLLKLTLWLGKRLIKFLLSHPLFLKLVLTVVLELKKDFCFRVLVMTGSLDIARDKKLAFKYRPEQKIIDSYDLFFISGKLSLVFKTVWDRIGVYVKWIIKIITEKIPNVLRKVWDVILAVPIVGSAVEGIGKATIAIFDFVKYPFVASDNSQQLQETGLVQEILLSSIQNSLLGFADVCMYSKVFYDSFKLLKELLDYRYCTKSYVDTNWYKQWRRDMDEGEKGPTALLQLYDAVKTLFVAQGREIPK